jgi:hypothetical protein
MSVVTATRPGLADMVNPYLDALDAAGIRATIDVRQLTPPCVVMHLPEFTWRFREGDFDVTWTATLVVQATTTRLAFDAMNTLLGGVQEAWHWQAVSGTPVDVPTPDGTANVLGLQLTWAGRVRAAN